MLTIDEQFEAIITGDGPVARVSPQRDPDPDRSASEEEQTVQSAPSEQEDGDKK